MYARSEAFYRAEEPRAPQATERYKLIDIFD